MEKSIRQQLCRHLKGGMAFIPVEKFIYDIPFESLGEQPAGLPYSLWQQLVHMVKAQRDILDFCVDPEYRELVWPEDYWPADPAPENKEDWDNALKAFFTDRDQLENMIYNTAIDLNAPVINDSEKTYLREILLVIEHNAYHTGQLLVILRSLGLYS